MMKKFILSIFVIVFLFGCKLTGRKSERFFSFDDQSISDISAETVENEKVAAIEKKRNEITVVVVPFAEKRLNTNKYGSVYKYLVPLVPYGTIKYERPEDARMFNTVKEFKVNLPESLARTFHSELEQAKIFNKVLFALNPQDVKADLILSGEINSTLYEGKTYSYGISFLCPVLWTIGLPAGSSYNKLTITLYLTKADTGEEVWKYAFNKEKTTIQGLYYNWGKDLNSYTSLMQEGLYEVIKNMKKKIYRIPKEKLKVKESEVPVEQKKLPVITQ